MTYIGGLPGAKDYAFLKPDFYKESNQYIYCHSNGAKFFWLFSFAIYFSFLVFVIISGRIEDNSGIILFVIFCSLIAFGFLYIILLLFTERLIIKNNKEVIYQRFFCTHKFSISDIKCISYSDKKGQFKLHLDNKIIKIDDMLIGTKYLLEFLHRFLANKTFDKSIEKFYKKIFP